MIIAVDMNFKSVQMIEPKVFFKHVTLIQHLEEFACCVAKVKNKLFCVVKYGREFFESRDE